MEKEFWRLQQALNESRLGVSIGRGNLDDLRKIETALNDFLGAFEKPLEALEGFRRGANPAIFPRKELAGQMTGLAEFGNDPAKILAAYKGLRDQVAVTRELYEGAKPFAEEGRLAGLKRNLEDDIKNLDRFLQHFKGQDLAEVRKQLEMGNVPGLLAKQDIPAPSAAKDLAEIMPKNFVESVVKTFDAIKKDFSKGIDKKRSDEVETKLKLIAERANLTAESLMTIANRIGSPLMIGPFNELAGVVGTTAKSLQRESALGGILGGFAGPAMGGGDFVGRLHFNYKVPGNLMDLAAQINAEADPTKAILKRKADLDQLVKLTQEGLMPKGFEVTPAMRDMDFGKQVGDLADKLGVNQRVKLMDGVTVGSAEDARLLSNFMVGNNGDMTTEAVLQLIFEYLKERDKNAKNKESVVFMKSWFPW